MMAEDHISARQAYVAALEDEENFVVIGDANGKKIIDGKVLVQDN